MDQPNFRPATNQPRARIPNAKMVSPTIRSHRVHQIGLEELRAAGVPESVLDTGLGLQQPDRQKAQQDHECEPDVDGPEGEREPAGTPEEV